MQWLLLLRLLLQCWVKTSGRCRIHILSLAQRAIPILPRTNRDAKVHKKSQLQPQGIVQEHSQVKKRLETFFARPY